MSRKDEERIRKEILRRVLQKDEFFDQQDEDQKERDATLEAIADITSLSREEVDEIEEQVRLEFKRKAGTRWMIALIAIFLLLIVAGYIGLRWATRPPRTAFSETFDRNANGWVVGEDYQYKRVIENGVYHYDSNWKGWCSWSTLRFKFPANYVIEMKSTWKSGVYDTYGLMLHQDDDNYYAFTLRADGAAGYTIRENDKWKFTLPWAQGRANRGDGKASNTQKIEVRNGAFQYYINGQLFQEGMLEGMNFNGLAIRTCGKQIIDFDHLEVRTLAGNTPGAPILLEPFDNADAGWVPRTNLNKNIQFENGRYVVETNKKGKCFYSALPLDVQGDCRIDLSSIWLSGEQGEYGLVLMGNDENNMAFELKNDGSTRMVQTQGEKTLRASVWQNKALPGNGEQMNLQTVRIKGKHVEYLVNNRPVAKWKIKNLVIKHVGMKVCNRQKVAFDQLDVQSE